MVFAQKQKAREPTEDGRGFQIMEIVRFDNKSVVVSGGGLDT